MESQLLMALEYIIEYRTYCYASQSYEIRENSCYKGVVKENFIGIIKRFKIISDKYRNRRKRFGLRFNLIGVICNMELV
jgi:hypothetical protein